MKIIYLTNKDTVFLKIEILKSNFPRKILNRKLVNVDTYVSVRNKLSLCYLITILRHPLSKHRAQEEPICYMLVFFKILSTIFKHQTPFNSSLIFRFNFFGLNGCPRYMTKHFILTIEKKLVFYKNALS